jgi:hypothetical protein
VQSVTKATSSGGDSLLVAANAHVLGKTKKNKKLLKRKIF